MIIAQPMESFENCSVSGIVWQLISLWDCMVFAQYMELYGNSSAYGIL